MATVDNKRILKNTVALYVRMLLVMGVSLYTSRVVLNQLGVADYGVYNVVGGVVVMLSFFNGSMATATQRFLAYAIGRDDSKLETETFSMAFFIHVMIACLLLLLAETVGLWFVKTYLVFPPESRQAAICVYHFSVLTAIIGIVTVPFTSMVIAHERMGVYAYVSILEAGLKLTVAFLLTFIAAEKLKLYAVLVMIAALIVSTVWITYSLSRLGTCRLRFVWSKSLFTPMLEFVGWQTFGQISLMLRTQGVNMLLNIFFGPILNAARGIAVQVNTAVQNFSLNFQTASVPQINKLYASDKLAEMRQLLFRTSKLTFLLMFCVSMPILAETEPILRLWLKIIPERGVLFVQLMLITALVHFLGGVLSFGAMATGNIRKYQASISSLYIFDIVVVYACFKLGCPPQSLFYVEMGFYAVGLFVQLYLLKGMIGLNPIDYLKQIVFKEIMAALVAALCVFLLKMLITQSVMGILLTMFIALFVSGLSSYLIALNYTERQFLNNMVKRTWNKIVK